MGSWYSFQINVLNLNLFNKKVIIWIGRKNELSFVGQFSDRILVKYMFYNDWWHIFLSTLLPNLTLIQVFFTWMRVSLSLKRRIHEELFNNLYTDTNSQSPSTECKTKSDTTRIFHWIPLVHSKIEFLSMKLSTSRVNEFISFEYVPVNRLIRIHSKKQKTS